MPKIQLKLSRALFEAERAQIADARAQIITAFAPHFQGVPKLKPGDFLASLQRLDEFGIQKTFSPDGAAERELNNVLNDAQFLIPTICREDLTAQLRELAVAALAPFFNDAHYLARIATQNDAHRVINAFATASVGPNYTQSARFILDIFARLEAQEVIWSFTPATAVEEGA